MRMQGENLTSDCAARSLWGKKELFRHFGNLHPRQPGTRRLEQGMLVLGLGNVQRTSQKCPAIVSLCSSWGQMLEHIIGVAFIDWGYRAAAARSIRVLSRAPQQGATPPSAKQTWAAVAPGGAEPSQPFSAQMTRIRLPGFKLPAWCFRLFLKRRDRWERTPSSLFSV